VLRKIDSLLQKDFRGRYERAERERMSLRDAASLIAVDRVARACRERGWV
jgi:glutamate dehydrogenase/leucine dehydrogenase